MDPKIEYRFENVAKSKTFKNIISEFDLGKKAVLDLGCSYGEFLAHFGKGSIGITIIEDEVKYGKARGLDIRLGNVEEDGFSLEEKFDVIFCNNMFEHLFSPHPFLLDIKQYLKPDGLLILGVPCIPKIVSLMRIDKFRGSLAGAHINFFTKDTLLKTVERGGWLSFSIRGFRFRHKFIDVLLNPIYPHFYVAAKVDPDFRYTDKRMRELSGYSKIIST